MKETMWYIQVYVSPVSPLWDDFFSSGEDVAVGSVVGAYQCDSVSARI